MKSIKIMNELQLLEQYKEVENKIFSNEESQEVERDRKV
jgi:hypothetical protein